MSQRECSGFNWPPASIPAQEPVSISPEAVKRAGEGLWLSLACDPSIACIFAPGLPAASSFADGVSQPASSTVLRLESELPAGLFPFCAGVPAIGVGQPANCAAVWQFIPPSRPSVPAPVLSVAFGVGHPLSPKPEPLPDVRCACARSAAIFRPDGVTRAFQVSAYKVEPPEPVLAGDLLAEYGHGLALLDVPVPERP